MCFTLDNKRVKIAKKNIPIFKYLEHDKWERRLKTPYRYADVAYGKLYKLGYKMQLLTDTQTTYRPEYIVKEVLVIEDGFHAFMTLEAAKKKALYHAAKSNAQVTVLVAKGFIPKGTRYYTNEKKEVVSEAMQYTKELWGE